MAKAHWEISRSVPVAVIVTILLQVASTLWWAKGVSASIEGLESQAVQARPTTERLARLETNMDALKTDVRDIKKLLSRPLKK
jgi:hypothetical protein